MECRYQIIVSRSFQALVTKRVQDLGADGLTLDELLGAVLKGYLQQTEGARSRFKNLFQSVELNGKPTRVQANFVSGPKSIPIKFKMN